MRVVVMAGLLGAALATPANACPQGARCIAMLSAPSGFTSIRSEVQQPPAPISQPSLTVRVTPAVPTSSDALSRSLSTFEPPVSYAEDLEMPELWAVVATRVKARLPRYEDRQQFSMVLSPVVVTMPTESTPGVGLSGAF